MKNIVDNPKITAYNAIENVFKIQKRKRIQNRQIHHFKQYKTIWRESEQLEVPAFGEDAGKVPDQLSPFRESVERRETKTRLLSNNFRLTN